ncbi:MAG TPA: serine/threonine-protein kinase [Polyangiales bacterium]|nr:serine/threonine-protein kinase [Polyangiales bacterium]
MTAEPSAERIHNRYVIRALLGRGGMASVYRAMDTSLNREVALKRLTVASKLPERTTAIALFEREFHTLTHLRHPHVISVYDYGVAADDSPYYTMELLDGGDLRERAPLDWREACRVFFEICSSLALLHSRRLLHRDISPRNIRCTQQGSAKLIDFGAMAPMNAGGNEVVGTPAFIAPETLHRLALDARTDLFSLGVTLYYTLTGRLPYPAATFSDVMAAWSGVVAAPSAFVGDIPAALDDLVLAMIALEPALRPHSAFDVMHRLAACAGLQSSESEAVARAYLATPSLVGRAEVLSRLRHKLTTARVSRGTAVLIEGPPGIGRSRVLDACALDAKTFGFTVLRATASGTHEAFAGARALITHLLAALPQHPALSEFPQLFVSQTELQSFSESALSAAQLQRALCQLLLLVSRTHPLLIAVDDVHRIDELSAALLAELTEEARRGGLLVVLTADREDAESHTLSVLSRRCEALPLSPLTHDETQLLLSSLFGDTAHLGMLADEIYRVALGNPGQCMEIAQYCVDRGVIRYAAGIWTLPSRLSAHDLPSSAAAALRARIADFSREARFLAEAHALAFYETLSDRDYRALLPELSAALIEHALAQLLAAGAIVRDGSSYLLANRAWAAAFVSALSGAELQARHQALAQMYRDTSDIGQVHHCFAGGQAQLGLELMRKRNGHFGHGLDHEKLLELNVGKMMWCYDLAIETAESIGLSPREICELRRWQYGGSITTEDVNCAESAGRWLEQLIHDTGLDLFRQDAANSNFGDRLTRALQGAQQRYLATPEHARVYSVEEGLRRLAEYVVYSIAIGGRTQNAALTRSLPSLLEPFAVLSPLLQVIWLNAQASAASNSAARYERARDLWSEALTKLDALSDRDSTYIVPMGNAIAYAVGLMDAHLGRASAAASAARLETDPYQRIAALGLRKVVQLEQGDAKGADRLRREAEVLSLQMRAPQMFKTLLPVELAVYARAGDLGGVALVVERMKPLAARHPGWVPHLMVAEASFDLVRGDFNAAQTKFEACIALTQPDAEKRSLNMATWVTACTGLAEALLSSERVEEARAAAASALSVCESHEIGSHAFALIRTLALAEAKLGQAHAAARLDASIAEQTRLGATGLQLGLSYEARARIAIWMADAPAFEHNASLAAREYRHSARSALGPRYERLMNEAARQGMRASVSFADLEASSGLGNSDQWLTLLTRNLSKQHSAEERSHVALQMICTAYEASTGQLYLFSQSGLMLCASQGSEPVAPQFSERVSELVRLERERAHQIDDMSTGELLDEAPPVVTVAIAGGDYELLPLRCVVDAASLLAGVAIVAANTNMQRTQRQNELLQALASTLLQTGDSSGMRLTDVA